jgi:hypothetical protein
MASYFELELTSDYVNPPSHFFVELDTTPPQITWVGDPSSTEAGTTLVIPYTISEFGESGINWVRFRDVAGGITPGTWDNYEITVNLPSTAYNGVGYIEAETEDDLGNVGLEFYAFTLTGGQAIPTEQQQGFSVGKAFTYGAGVPAFLKEEFTFEAQADLLRLTKERQLAQLDLNRSKTIKLAANTDLLRSKVLEFDCEREPAYHHLKLRREDEELMLLL